MMGGPGGMGMGGPGAFFRNPEFIKMLELTPAQTEEIQEVIQSSMEELRTQMQDRVQRNPGTPPNPAEMRQRFEGMQDKITGVLKPAQQTKAWELAFQLTGGLDSPVLNDRTLETLDLTADQKEKVRKLVAERDAEFGTVMQGFDWRGATPEQREKFRSDNEGRTKKYTDQIKALLTAEQKGKAEKLSTDAPALREKLGMPAPGQMGQRRGQQGGQSGSQPYTPGANSWRPGQEVPGAADTAPSPQRTRQRGGFPRGESP